jgi:16S rRNA (guanine966-N2)-methyltransferase
MRIIAGQRRGHKIDGPRPSIEMKPTSDRVRESLFNIVGELMAERIVVDLFAGTGAIGLEALSRGAKRAVFVERNRELVALIHRNIATLRYEDRTQVRLADAYRWARTFQAVDAVPMAVFLDPPYQHYESRRSQMNQLLRSMAEKLPENSLIVAEAGRELDGDVLPDRDLWDVRHYGETRIAIRILSGQTLGSTVRCAEITEANLTGGRMENGDA